jgi:hypothetical protein
LVAVQPGGNARSCAEQQSPSHKNTTDSESDAGDFTIRSVAQSISLYPFELHLPSRTTRYLFNKSQLFSYCGPHFLYSVLHEIWVTSGLRVIRPDSTRLQKAFEKPTFEDFSPRKMRAGDGSVDPVASERAAGRPRRGIDWLQHEAARVWPDSPHPCSHDVKATGSRRAGTCRLLQMRGKRRTGDDTLCSNGVASRTNRGACRVVVLKLAGAGEAFLVAG